MTTRSKQKDLLGLFGWLIATFALSAVGARASIEARSFYSQLVQPEWAPPPWLFGPVWTVLYAMMAVAAWLVWRSCGFRGNHIALALFFVQLALNALWSWLFFAWNLGALALAEVLVLWVLIAATLLAFWRVRPLAGMLLVPYLIWVGFAAALNYALWQLNPQFLALAS
ncbi:MAG: tryptophan-rich sensory protein [Gammaproteobacteria bacterium]|nr:tryptophan-rich sensory protein [Gammaproteobacteria bacterium]